MTTLASCQPGGFLLGREPPLGRQMIDHAREMLTQRGKQLIALHACLLHEVFDPVFAESGLQLLRCDRTVLPPINPRACDFTVPASLEILDGVANAAAQDRARY